jgi:hypothetical protein
MGGGVSSSDQERYMGGKTFAKYFKKDIWPSHQGSFEILGLTEPRAYVLFTIFAKIDYNGNGTIDSEECFRYFQAPRSKFTERIFFFERRDTDSNAIIKSLTFKEFALLLWSFCTLTPEGIARFIFEIFDVDNNFTLTYAHLETMYRMLYNISDIEEGYISVYPLEEPIPSRSSSNRISTPKRAKGNNDDEMSNSFSESKRSASEGLLLPPTASAPAIGTAPRHNLRSFHMDSEKTTVSRAQLFLPSLVTKSAPETTIVRNLAQRQKMTIDKVTFTTVSGKNPRLLIFPALAFQKLIRKKSCGLAVWKILTAYRQTTSLFSVFDKDCDRLDEAHIAIFRAVENQVLENQRLSADALLQQNSAKLRYEADAAQRELQLREKQELIERRRYEASGPDLPMKRAWQLYETKKKAFESEEFIANLFDVMRRKEMRMELFQVLEHAIAKSREYYAWKDERELKLAEGTEIDHLQRFEDFRDQRPEGKQLSVLVEITHLLRLVKEEIDAKNAKNKYYRDDQKPEKQVLVETNLAGCERLLDPILRCDEATTTLAELGKRLNILTRRDLTEEGTLARRVGTKQLWLAARQTATKELVQFVRSRTVRQVKEELKKSQEQREREWKKTDWFVTCNFGSRITQWEYVLNKESNRPCYMSSTSGERRHPKTAFCEICDAIMVQHELRCIQCDAPRSAKNLLLYRPLGFKDITLE